MFVHTQSFLHADYTAGVFTGTRRYELDDSVGAEVPLADSDSI